MDSKVLSDVASGVFRLRKDDPHMTESIIVDVHDDDYTTLTTVDVRNGTVVLHCITSWDEVEDDEDESEEDSSEAEEAASDESESEEEDDDDDDSDEDDSDDEKTGTAKTYTVASGNSVTVRALAVRLAPVGVETAEGTYQVQMMKAVD